MTLVNGYLTFVMPLVTGDGSLLIQSTCSSND